MPERYRGSRKGHFSLRSDLGRNSLGQSLGEVTTVDWATIFEESSPESGATEQEITILTTQTLAELTESEIVEVDEWRRKNGQVIEHPLAARRWNIPNRPFPPSYIEFLRWSNGGEFANGERQFASFFAIEEIRDTVLGWEIPEQMNGAIPIGMDGCGGFYLFDMRKEPKETEYPIVIAHCGSLAWNDACVVANSFPDLCIHRTDQWN